MSDAEMCPESPVSEETRPGPAKANAEVLKTLKEYDDLSDDEAETKIQSVCEEKGADAAKVLDVLRKYRARNKKKRSHDSSDEDDNGSKRLALMPSDTTEYTVPPEKFFPFEPERVGRLKRPVGKKFYLMDVFVDPENPFGPENDLIPYYGKPFGGSAKGQRLVYRHKNDDPVKGVLFDSDLILCPKAVHDSKVGPLGDYASQMRKSDKSRKEQLSMCSRRIVYSDVAIHANAVVEGTETQSAYALREAEATARFIDWIWACLCHADAPARVRRDPGKDSIGPISQANCSIYASAVAKRNQYTKDHRKRLADEEKEKNKIDPESFRERIERLEAEHEEKLRNVWRIVKEEIRNVRYSMEPATRVLKQEELLSDEMAEGEYTRTEEDGTELRLRVYRDMKDGQFKGALEIPGRVKFTVEPKLFKNVSKKAANGAPADEMSARSKKRQEFRDFASGMIAGKVEGEDEVPDEKTREVIAEALSMDLKYEAFDVVRVDRRPDGSPAYTRCLNSKAAKLAEPDAIHVVEGSFSIKINASSTFALTVKFIPSKIIYWGESEFSTRLTVGQAYDEIAQQTAQEDNEWAKFSAKVASEGASTGGLLVAPRPRLAIKAAPEVEEMD